MNCDNLLGFVWSLSLLFSSFPRCFNDVLRLILDCFFPKIFLFFFFVDNMQFLSGQLLLDFVLVTCKTVSFLLFLLRKLHRFNSLDIFFILFLALQYTNLI